MQYKGSQQYLRQSPTPSSYNSTAVMSVAKRAQAHAFEEPLNGVGTQGNTEYTIRA